MISISTLIIPAGQSTAVLSYNPTHTVSIIIQIQRLLKVNFFLRTVFKKKKLSQFQDAFYIKSNNCVSLRSNFNTILITPITEKRNKFNFNISESEL